jgi:hypothetical protein
MHADTLSTTPKVGVKGLKKGKDTGGSLIFPSGSMHIALVRSDVDLFISKES